jgi:hypothetical protein
VNGQIVVCLFAKILRLSEALHYVTGPPLAWVRPSEVSVQESGAGSATDYVSGVK